MLQWRSHSNIKWLVSFKVHWCPGSVQDRVNFCSSQEGHSPEPGVIRYHHAWQGGWHKVGWFSFLFCWGVWSSCTGFQGVSNCTWIICLSYTHCYYYCCFGSLSYFIAVSNKWFVSQPVIFTFLCLQLSSPSCHGGGGKWVSHVWSGEFQGEY